MAKVLALADAPKNQTRKPRSFWGEWRRHCGGPTWFKAPDGGYWWGTDVLIERLGKPPKRGEETEMVLNQIQRHRAKETLPVPEAYTLEPAHFDRDPATCNFGKVGTDTLLMNADYAAHITRKGYRMAQIAGDGVQPVLFFKGELLMGLVMPLLSPEHIARAKAAREGKRA